MLLVLTVLIQVFSRFSPISVPWGTEFATFLFIWLVFIGGYFTIIKGLNITFDLIQDMLPPSIWKVVFTTTNVISCAFLILMAVLGTQLLSQMGSTSPVLGVPLSIVYAAIPVGAIVMLVAQVESYFTLMKKRNEDTC